MTMSNMMKDALTMLQEAGEQRERAIEQRDRTFAARKVTQDQLTQNQRLLKQLQEDRDDV